MTDLSERRRRAACQHCIYDHTPACKTRWDRYIQGVLEAAEYAKSFCEELQTLPKRVDVTGLGVIEATKREAGFVLEDLRQALEGENG